MRQCGAFPGNGRTPCPAVVAGTINEGRRQVSESQSDDQSRDGQSSGSTSSRQSDGGRASKPASDPIADLQRWLMKQGARSMAHQVADNVRRTLGQQKRDSGDVWDTATTEPPPDEPPECQWCPVCQAARRLRVSGPGLSARIADAGGVLASVVQEAFTAVEQAMKTPSAERSVVTPPATSARNGVRESSPGSPIHIHPTTAASPDASAGAAAGESPAAGESSVNENLVSENPVSENPVSENAVTENRAAPS
jgi:hypothetical protein